MKTKKSPRATERATIVTVRGDAMESPRQVPTNLSALRSPGCQAQAVSTGRARGALRRQQAERMTKGEEGAGEKN